MALMVSDWLTVNCGGADPLLWRKVVAGALMA